MNRTAQRYWQVWQAWAKWPVFRVMVLAMLLQWFARLLLYHGIQWGENGYLLVPYDGRGHFDYGRYGLHVFSSQLASRYGFIYCVANLLNLIAVPLAFFVYLTPIVLIVGVPVVIVGRVKSQMAGWRSALTPQFRRPHLVVSALISLAIFLGMGVAPAALQAIETDLRVDAMPLAVQYHHGGPFRYYYIDPPADPTHHHDSNRQDYQREAEHVLALESLNNLAEALCAAIAIGLAGTFISPWMVIAVALFLALVVSGLGLGAMHWYDFYDSIRGFVNPFGEETITVTKFFEFDLCLWAALWLRLGHLPVGRDEIIADERLPWLARLLSGSKAKIAGTLMHAGVFARAGHRRQIGLGHRFICVLAIYLSAVIALAPAMTDYYGLWFRDNSFAFCTVIVAVITSSLSIGLSWPQRFTALADVELLRPSRRNGFARELGLAMLSDTIEIFVLTLAAMLIPIAIWSPLALQNAAFWTGFTSALLSSALIFGVLVWAMPLNSIAATMGAMIAGIVAAALLVEQAFSSHRLGPSIVAAAVGIALAADAYRRWISADIIGSHGRHS